MKVVKKGAFEPLNVYGVYQLSGPIYYLVTPQNYVGLLAIRSADADLVDGNIPANFEFKLTKDGFTLFPICLGNEQFLERLLECDPEAFAEFQEKIGIDGWK